MREEVIQLNVNSSNKKWGKKIPNIIFDVNLEQTQIKGKINKIYMQEGYKQEN